MPPMKVGTEGTRLVVPRGASASGKSSVAAGVRDRFGRGLALVGQDNLRRTVLRERGRPGAANIDLIELTARYALDAAHHAVVEVIPYADHYGDVSAHLRADHRGPTHGYYLDGPLDETVARHATKPIAGEVDEARLREWYRPRDRTGRPAAARILNVGPVVRGPTSGVIDRPPAARQDRGIGTALADSRREPPLPKRRGRCRCPPSPPQT
ncbi:kinase [Streptomyces sp. NPDC045251]|uniref:kinase n=1 Tax=unclassified Streptomyces TaxID=2593676 RepID=UPI00340FFEDA